MMLSMAVTASAAEDNGLRQQQLAVGEYTTMVVKEDGSLWVWGIGARAFGEDINTAEPVKLMDNVVSVSANMMDVYALKADGTLWRWYGSKTPAKVLDDVIQFSSGLNHVAAVKKDGSLWAFGGNECGQIGDGTIDFAMKAVKVMDDVAYVSCGTAVTAAIKKDGSLWTWGDNMQGQLGNGGLHNTELYTPENEYHGGTVGSGSGGVSIEYFGWKFLTLPTKIMDNVTVVSCGYSNMAAVQSDGSLWTWGENKLGQLGIGKQTDTSMVPVKVFDYGILSVSVRSSAMAAIRTDNSLWTWGNGAYGVLGIGKEASYLAPIKVMDDVVAAHIGENQAAAIKSDGTVWLWGDNLNGHLGFPDYNLTTRGFLNDLRPCQTTPIMLADFNTYDVSDDTSEDMNDDTVEDTIDLSGVSDWAKDQVAAAYEAGIVPEKLTGNPGYQDKITREQFAELAISFVAAICNDIPEYDQTLAFSDCKNPLVVLAASAGIVSGVGDNKFDPNAFTNREQIASMIYRAIKYARTQTGFDPVPLPASLEGFTDKDEVSSWAAESVGMLAANKIMSGTSTTQLSPKSPCTVEQSIALFYRIYKVYQGS